MQLMSQKFSICSVQIYLESGDLGKHEIMQPVLLPVLALPLRTESSARPSKVLFLGTYCRQSAPKCGIFPWRFWLLRKRNMSFLFKKNANNNCSRISCFLPYFLLQSRRRFRPNWETVQQTGPGVSRDELPPGRVSFPACSFVSPLSALYCLLDTQVLQGWKHPAAAAAASAWGYRESRDRHRPPGAAVREQGAAWALKRLTGAVCEVWSGVDFKPWSFCHSRL